jgi:hypothetical protein
MTESEALCESCGNYDGFGCNHPKLESFPFKMRKSFCKYYDKDDSDDDMDALVQDQWEREHYFNGDDWDD